MNADRDVVTEIPPPELKERALAHMSERMLAMGEELREMALGISEFGGTVDRHETELFEQRRRTRELEARVHELEARVGTGEHKTIGEEE